MPKKLVWSDCTTDLTREPTQAYNNRIILNRILKDATNVHLQRIFIGDLNKKIFNI